MAKTELPAQKYDLVSVSKLGMENTTPLVCEHCGRLIFNIATLRGADGKIYSVGLTCLKKILKANAGFLSVDDNIKMMQQEHAFDQAANVLKWLKKTMAEYDGKGAQYRLQQYDSEDGTFWIYAELTAPYRMYSTGMWLFHTATLNTCTLPLFRELLK